MALASVYRDQKKYAEAKAEYEKAITLQPKNGTTYIGRAYLWIMGDGDQAMRSLTNDRALIDSYPLSAAEGHVTRGVFSHGFGKYPEAIAEFDKANSNHAGMAGLLLLARLHVLHAEGLHDGVSRLQQSP